MNTPTASVKIAFNSSSVTSFGSPLTSNVPWVWLFFRGICLPFSTSDTNSSGENRNNKTHHVTCSDAKAASEQAKLSLWILHSTDKLWYMLYTRIRPPHKKEKVFGCHPLIVRTLYGLYFTLNFLVCHLCCNSCLSFLLVCQHTLYFLLCIFVCRCQ